MLTVVPFPIKFKNSDTLKGEIMDPSYTQDLRNRPEKHPETPTDAILIIVSMIRELLNLLICTKIEH